MKRETLTLYNYIDTPVVFPLQDKEISMVSVIILSGDETCTVFYEDGTQDDFDSCDLRFESIFDGTYTVRGETLGKWIDFDPIDVDCVSYARKEAVYLMMEEEATT